MEVKSKVFFVKKDFFRKMYSYEIIEGMIMCLTIKNLRSGIFEMAPRLKTLLCQNLRHANSDTKTKRQQWFHKTVAVVMGPGTSCHGN